MNDQPAAAPQVAAATAAPPPASAPALNQVTAERDSEIKRAAVYAGQKGCGATSSREGGNWPANGIRWYGKKSDDDEAEIECIR